MEAKKVIGREKNGTLFFVRKNSFVAIYLLNFPDPAVDSRLKLVEEGWVFHFVSKVCDLRLLSTLVALLCDVCDGGVDEQTDFRNLNVLLQVKETHLQLGNFFLHGWSHLIPVPGRCGSISIT